jgi:alpha-methylacyl-CoA racemase
MPHAASNHASDSDDRRPLAGVKVLLFALHVPGPVAAHRLQQLGATVRKIEPLAGDPLSAIAPTWYDALHRGVDVQRLDLRDTASRTRADAWLAEADLLITSFRPSSLERLGLDFAALSARFPQLCHVAIVGEGGARAELPGHDLTYQARAGLVAPPSMPRTLLADLTGAERVVSASLLVLLNRARGRGERHAEVALADAVRMLAAPLEHDITTANGPLGGMDPLYAIYESSDAWIALAALEPHFAMRLLSALGIAEATTPSLAAVFRTRTSAAWEAWAEQHNIPLSAVALAAR